MTQPDPVDVDLTAAQAAYDALKAKEASEEAALAAANETLTAEQQQIVTLTQQNGVLTAQVVALEAQIKPAFFATAKPRLGIYLASGATPTAHEAAIGREVAMTIYAGVGTWNRNLKTVGDRALRIQFASRSNVATNPKCADIIAGKQDSWLDQTFTGLAAIANPLIIDFNAERDAGTDLGGANSVVAASGTPTQHLDAVEYMAELAAKSGLDAPWGMCFQGGHPDAATQQLWRPGLFKWIGVDPYTLKSTSWSLPATLWQTFKTRIANGLFGDEGKTLPYVICETGCISDPRRKTDWIPGMADAAGIADAVFYWDDATSAYNFRLDPTEYPALAAAATSFS